MSGAAARFRLHISLTKCHWPILQDRAMAPLAEEGKRRSSERALVLSPSRHSSIRLGSDARTAHQQPLGACVGTRIRLGSDARTTHRQPHGVPERLLIKKIISRHVEACYDLWFSRKSFGRRHVRRLKLGIEFISHFPKEGCHHFGTPFTRGPIPWPILQYASW